MACASAEQAVQALTIIIAAELKGIGVRRVHVDSFIALGSSMIST